MSIVRIDPEGRRNAEHIAIIVVVDLASIQSQFDSSSSSATTIADDGHRPIHLIASNPTGVTVTGPALRTVATGPSTCKALARDSAALDVNRERRPGGFTRDV